MPRSIRLRIIIIIVIVAVVVGSSVQLVCVVIVVASAQVKQSIIWIGQIRVDGLLTLDLLLFARGCLIWNRRCRRRIVTRGWCIVDRRCRWRIGCRAITWWRIFWRLRRYRWIKIRWRWAWSRHVWWIEGSLLLIVLLLLVGCDRRCAWICLVALTCVIWLICVWPVGTCCWRCRFRAKFTLSYKTLQMWHESKSKWILNVHSFDRYKISRHFRCTFSEADNMIVHGKTLRIKSNRIDSWENQ